MSGYGNADRMRETPNARWRRRGPTRVVLVVLVVAGSLLATGAAEAGARCFGRRATIVGTRGDDLIVGTAGDDVIDGLRGFDRIRGLGGDDRICGGGESDFVRGGGGDDAIEGAGGSDTAHGGPGADRIVLGAGGVEGLFGGPGDDRLFGGSGSFDGLIGGAGDDLLHGGLGQDLAEFFGAPNGVRADLEAGTATGQGEDRLIATEGLVGSNFDDVLLGDAISNLIVAQQGDDVVDARGSGTLEGLGADLMDGGGGDDVLEGDAGADIVTFEDAPVPVTVDLTLGTATGWGADSLSGIEAIVGSSFDDALTGDAQDNAFAAGAGDDAIDGRGGTDQAAYFDAAGSVVANLRAGVTTGWGTDTLLGVEDLTGSGSADTLTGDDGPNAIVGGSGPDLLVGAAGDDLLVGAEGNDQVDGGDGLDTCDAETELACEVDPVPTRTRVGGWLASWGNRRVERPA